MPQMEKKLADLGIVLPTPAAPIANTSRRLTAPLVAPAWLSPSVIESFSDHQVAQWFRTQWFRTQWFRTQWFKPWVQTISH